MKKILYNIVAFVGILPLIMLFNDNFESIYINGIGLLYVLAVWAFTAKTQVGRRFFRQVYKSLK